MLSILKKWLEQTLGGPSNWFDIDSLTTLLRDGTYIARILHHYKIITREELLSIEETLEPPEAFCNYKKIKKWLLRIKIEITNNDIMDITECQGNTSVMLLIQIFIELEHDEDLTKYLTGDETDVDQTSRAETFKIDPRCLEISDKLDSGQWTRKRLQEIVEKFKITFMQYEKYLGKKNQRLAAEKKLLKEGDKEDVDSEGNEEPASHVDKPTYADLLCEKRRALRIPEFVPDLKEAKRIAKNMRKRRIEKKLRELEVSKLIEEEPQIDAEIEIPQSGAIEFELVSRYTERSEIEKKIADNLFWRKYDINMEAQERIRKMEEWQKKRDIEFVERLYIADPKGRQKFHCEYKAMVNLHRSLYDEKMKLQALKEQNLCWEVTHDLAEWAIKSGEFKKMFGVEPSDKVRAEWATLFVKSEPVEHFEAYDDSLLCCLRCIPEFIDDITKLPIKDKYLIDDDLEDYFKKRSVWCVKIEQDVEYHITCAMNVLGYIVHRLLYIKYPKKKLLKPDIPPNFEVACCVVSPIDRDQCNMLRRLLDNSEITVITIEEVINFCCNSYENEMVVEYEQELSPDLEPPQTNLNFSEKVAQTPKVFPEEPVELSRAAQLGKVIVHQRDAGLPCNITNRMFIDMFVEYLIINKPLRGWVLLNFPTTYEQAAMLEQTLSAEEPPKDYFEKLKRKLSFETEDIINKTEDSGRNSYINASEEILKNKKCCGAKKVSNDSETISSKSSKLSSKTTLNDIASMTDSDQIHQILPRILSKIEQESFHVPIDTNKCTCRKYRVPGENETYEAIIERRRLRELCPPDISKLPKPTIILCKWLREIVGPDLDFEKVSLKERLRDGTLIGAILYHYNVITKVENSTIQKTDDYACAYCNYLKRVRSWLMRVNIEITREDICKLTLCDCTAGLNILIEMYKCLEDDPFLVKSVDCTKCITEFMRDNKMCIIDTDPKCKKSIEQWDVEARAKAERDRLKEACEVSKKNSPKPTVILYKWLCKLFSIPPRYFDISLKERLFDGVLVGIILHMYKIISNKELETIRSTSDKAKAYCNYSRIKKWLSRIEIDLSKNDIIAINNCCCTTGLTLLLQMYMKLEDDKCLLKYLNCEKTKKEKEENLDYIIDPDPANKLILDKWNDDVRTQIDASRLWDVCPDILKEVPRLEIKESAAHRKECSCTIDENQKLMEKYKDYVIKTPEEEESVTKVEAEVIEEEIEQNDDLSEKTLENLQNSKLLPNIIQMISKPYKTVLTAYIKMEVNDEEEPINADPVLPIFKQSSGIAKFYIDQGCFYGLEFKEIDHEAIIKLAKTIIGDYTLPMKTSMELLGDNYLQIFKEFGIEVIRSPVAVVKVDAAIQPPPVLQPPTGDITYEDAASQFPEPEEKEWQEPAKPGEPLWKYINLKISKVIAVNLATQWENVERIYLSGLKEMFGEKRTLFNAILPYLNHVKEVMGKFIDRPDCKQLHLHSIQKSINECPIKERIKPEVKKSLICQIENSIETLKDVCDKKMKVSENERRKLIENNWIFTQLCRIVNNSEIAIQLEIDRFVDTIQLIRDYYCAIIYKNLHRQSDDLIPKIVMTKSTCPAQTEIEINDALKDPFKQLVYTGFHNYIKQVYDRCHRFIHDVRRDALDYIIRIAPVLEPKRVKGRFFEPDFEVQRKASRLLQEWRSVVHGEKERCSMRLEMIKLEISDRIDEVMKWSKNTFHQLYNEIKTKYDRDLKCVGFACDILVQAILEEKMILPELRFEGNHLCRIKLMLFCERPTPDVPNQIYEESNFSLNQLEYMTIVFTNIAPSGYLMKCIFLIILQDLLYSGRKCEGIGVTPQIWLQLSKFALQRACADLYGNQEYMYWRDFIIGNLGVTYPTRLQLMNVRRQFRRLDPKMTEFIDASKFHCIKFWFEKMIDDKKRIARLKNILQKVYYFGKDQIRYSLLLLDFSKDEDPVAGFVKALEMALGKHICYNEREGKNFIERVLYQRQMDELKRQLLEEKERVLSKDVKGILGEMVEKIVHERESAFLIDYVDENDFVHVHEEEEEEFEETEDNEEESIKVPYFSYSQCKFIGPEEEFANIDIGFESSGRLGLVYFLPYDLIMTVIFCALPSHLKYLDSCQTFADEVTEIYKSYKNETFNNAILAHEFLNDEKFREMITSIMKFYGINPVKYLIEVLNEECKEPEEHFGNDNLQAENFLLAWVKHVK